MPSEAAEEFKEMELWEHLQELRSRLIRSVAYMVGGMIVAFIVYPWLYRLFFAPIDHIMRKHPKWFIGYQSITEGFMLQLEVAFIAGLVIAIPLITFEIWGFVAPGLTRNERKVCYLVFPLSIFFFFLGITCGYIIMEPALMWFAGYIPADSVLIQNPAKYLSFEVKMVVAFGVCFQLPLVLMAMSYIGFLSSKSLREQWRIWIVVCAAIGAFATPGGDVFSMVVMTVALIILYIASIGLCGIVERYRTSQDRRAAL
jgi:sec-independent protein translocase protein TatC